MAQEIHFALETASETDADAAQLARSRPAPVAARHRLAAAAGAAALGGLCAALAAPGRARASASDARVSAAAGPSCSATGADCSSTKCCQERDRLCYTKDANYSGCRHECMPGSVFQHDASGEKWGCRLEGGVAQAGDSVYKPRMGCGNWADILLKSVPNVPSQDECYRWCRDTAGCQQANYQPLDCGPTLGKAARTCYLFKGGCKEAPNTCWELMSSPSPDPVGEAKSGTGCSNWRSLLIANFTLGNPNQCAAKCAEVHGCKATNFQPAECSGDERASRGMCYLFEDGCKEVSNPCWDFYDVDATVANNFYSTIDSPTKAGKCHMVVHNKVGFRVGDIVGTQFKNGSNFFSTVAEISGSSLVVSPCVTQDLAGGEPVWVKAPGGTTTAPPAATTSD